MRADPGSEKERGECRLTVTEVGRTHRSLSQPVVPLMPLVYSGTLTEPVAHAWANLLASRTSSTTALPLSTAAAASAGGTDWIDQERRSSKTNFHLRSPATHTHS